MRTAIALAGCIGLGYFAEVHSGNPQKYVVWGGISFMLFGGYLYLAQVTSFAFALPVALLLVAIAGAAAYVNDERGFVIFGVYGAIGIIILFGHRFSDWRWEDWKSFKKILNTLRTPGRIR